MSLFAKLCFNQFNLGNVNIQNLARRTFRCNITKRFRIFSCCDFSSSFLLIFPSRPPVFVVSVSKSVHKNPTHFNRSNFGTNRYEPTVNDSELKNSDKNSNSVGKITGSQTSGKTAENMGRLFNDFGDGDGVVVKMRGLPWSTTVDDIIQFFDGVNIKNGRAGVQITRHSNGRPSGVAYVELETEEDMENALQKDKQHLGHRYIEVFTAKKSERDWTVQHQGIVDGNAFDQGCVRLRGLPFDSTKDDIATFFSGLDMVPNGITIPEGFNGKSSGEAYVQFVDKETAEKALEKHKEKIGHRYIEIFKTTLDEIRSAASGGDYVDKMRSQVGHGFGRPSPYDRNDRFGGSNRFGGGGGGPMRGGRGGRSGGFDDNSWNSGPRPGGRWSSADIGPSANHIVHMRGLPFRATEEDIADFFRPTVPQDIIIHYESGGRPSGEADVEFASHEDAVAAMGKDRTNMQHRYIELFLKSTPGPGPRGGFGGPGPSGMGGGSNGGPFGGGDNSFGFGMGRSNSGGNFGGRGNNERSFSGFGNRGGNSNGGFFGGVVSSMFDRWRAGGRGDSFDY